MEEPSSLSGTGGGEVSDCLDKQPPMVDILIGVYLGSLMGEEGRVAEKFLLTLTQLRRLGMVKFSVAVH